MIAALTWTAYAAAGRIFAALWQAGLVKPGGNSWHPERSGDHARRIDHPLWIHAASLGEVNVARIYVPALSRVAPLYLTVGTRTGREAAARWMADVPCGFAPVDTEASVKRFVDRVAPSGLVIVETEIWPHVLRGFRGPIWFANASLSERSLRRLRLAGRALSTIWSEVRCVFAQSPSEADRFRQLGVPETRVRVAGQAKQFAAAPGPDLDSRSRWRSRLGLRDGERLWVCGSLRRDEWPAVEAMFAGVGEGPDVPRILIAPRHMTDVTYFAGQCEQAGHGAALVSVSDRDSDRAKVMILDTHGDLEAVYASADLVFLGGTVGPHGGHNPNEPARFGVPVVTGPFTDQIESDLKLLGEAGIAYRLERLSDFGTLAASLRAHDAQAACTRLRELLANCPHPADVLANAVSKELQTHASG